jgi:hypothetical protein
MAEEEASTSFEIQKAQIEAQKAVGKILASSETSGLSLDALIADTYRQQAIYKDTMGYNQDVALGQLEREKTGLRQEAIRRINSYQMQTPTHQTITPPIYTPYVFQEQVATPMNWGGILGTGLNTFAQTGGVQATTNWLKTPSQKSKITMG